MLPVLSLNVISEIMAKTYPHPVVILASEEHRIQRTFGGSVSETNRVPSAVTFNGQRSYGDNYKDWKYRLAHHQQATTNLTIDTCEGRMGKHRTTAVYSTTFNLPGFNQYDTLWGTGDLMSYDYSTSISLSDADNLAKSRFLKSIRETRNQFQGGVFIGEIRETLHMIRHPAESLINGVRHYLGLVKKRTRDLRSVRKPHRLRVASRIISDTWLETTFGLMPLISDIQDAVSALERQALEFDGSNVRGRGVSERRYSVKGSVSGGIKLFNYVDNIHERYAVTYRGYVMASLSVPARQASLFGISLEQFAPTVWELIPWSFLSDYFVNLDDIIESATTSTTGLNWVSKTIVKELEATRYHSFDLNQWMANFNPAPLRTVVVTARHGDSYFRRRNIQRAPYVGSLVPSLTWKFHQSDLHLANIAALLLGQASGLSRGLRSLI